MKGMTMHDSGALGLQINEMLPKVQPSYEKRMLKIKSTLQTLKRVIEALPDQDSSTISAAEAELSDKYNVRVPFPEPRPAKDVKYKLSYARPANVNVVGSFARQTAIKSDDQVSIDLAVTMPSKIFQDSDYLNHRYFHKRSYYLARIAAGISESNDCPFEIQFSLQNDNHLQPILIITPNLSDPLCDFAQSKCQIKILLAADENLFPIAKTLPNKACVRSFSTSQSAQHKPTPFYNGTMRSECCALRSLELLHRASSDSHGFKDACVLGSIWLRQRGFGAGLASGGFGPFEWACTVALLMQGGGLKGRPRLSKQYDSFQIFQATLEYFSGGNLVETPAFIGHGKAEVYGGEVPIFFDNALGLNMLFKMTPWSYDLLRHEATCTLKLFKDPFADHLDACFITKVDDPTRRFDCLATFNPGHSSTTATSSLTSDAYDGVTQTCFRAFHVLKRAISDRADLITLQGVPPSSWTVSVKPPPSHTGRLLIGMLLNTQHSHRTVDRGPSADEKEVAARFRSFWGEKAELRRFNDGSIRESLIWYTHSDNSVLKQILTYAVGRNIGREAADSFWMMTDNRNVAWSGLSTDVVAEDQPTMAAYELLEKQLRGLEEMPLPIRHISLAGGILRKPSPTTNGENAPSIQSTDPPNVLIQFGGSSRWPEDFIAVQRTKIALLLKIGELLENSTSTSSVQTRIGLESQTSNLSKGLINNAFLDVSYNSGAFFRLKIHHEREVWLLERALKNASSETIREGAASALFTYKRDFIQAPLHTQAVYTLSTRFPALLPSVCLMKNWRDSQLLSPHVCDELIELLTIRTFTQPYPWAVPGSAVTGFLRTLTFISKWDWRFYPLIIDFSGDMQLSEYDAITTRLKAWRKVDPAMNRIAMFVASNDDPEGISWTGLGPSKVVAARLTSLAKVACSITTEQGIDLQATALFTASLADYDFILRLNPTFVNDNIGLRTKKRLQYKNLQIDGQQYPQRVPPNVAVRSFIDELRTLYGNNVLFFHNGNGGTTIGGVWNPQTKPRSWKVNVGYSTIAVKDSSKDEGQIVLNKAGILYNIAELGGDMILKIEESQ